MKHPCPSCGFQTIDSYWDYEICDVCFWEDDPAQAARPYSPYWANWESLVDYHAAALANVPEDILIFTKWGVVFHRSKNWKSIFDWFIESRSKIDSNDMNWYISDTDFIYSFEDSEDIQTASNL